MRSPGSVCLSTSLVLTSLLLGCGSAGISSILGTDPGSVVRNQYMACNSGNYSKAESYLTPELKRLVDGDLGTASGGIKGLCDQATHNGNISTVVIKSTSMRGEGAQVVADIHFKDGSVKAGDITQLLKEDGNWKITIGGN